MRDKAIGLLNATGLTDVENDPLFDYIVQAVTEMILNKTNQSEIPEGLYMLGAYRVCGQYFRMKKDSGQLTEEYGFNLESAIKQIEEGDTSVTYAIGDGDLTPESRLENLIKWLLKYGESQLYRYRKLVW